MSALPNAIEALVTLIQATDSTLLVSDGWPIGQGPRMVLVGVTDQNPSSTWTRAWAGLGQKTEDETFDIPCVIWCATGDSTQKTVRDQAFTILAAIRTALLADLTLGVLGPPGVAEIQAGSLDQTNTADDAGKGRSARLYFTVHCTSRL